MATPLFVRDVAAASMALVTLTLAFIVGSGSSATATQGEAVIAGQTNSETSPTRFENSSALGDPMRARYKG